MASGAIRFRVLGPVEVDGVERAMLGAPKQRALLAALALSPGAAVSVDYLVAALWDDPPASATAVLQTYVSGLRRALEPDHRRGDPWQVLITRPPGYLLDVPPAEIDLHAFTALVTVGREQLAAGRPSAAAESLRNALALWRGPALADLGDAPVVRSAAFAEQLRIDAVADRIEADLELGRHGDLIAELETLVAQEPLRERLRGQLMLALYRDGRQARALQVYDEGRAILADELGVDPSPELQRIFDQILRQDPALEPTATGEPDSGVRTDGGASWSGRRSVRRWGRPLAAFVAVAAAVAVLFFVLAGGSAEAGPLQPGSLGLIDLATGEAESQVSLGELPSSLLVEHGTLWAALSTRGVLASTDAQNPGTVRELTLAPGLAGMAYADSAIWVAEPDESLVVRVDTQSGRIAQRVRVGGRPSEVISAGGSVWAANRLDDTVSRIDPRTGAVVQTLRVGRDPVAMAGDAHTLWVAAAGDGTLTRVDLPAARVTQRFRTVGSPHDLVVAGHALWVSDPSAGTLSRIEPQSGALVQAVPAARGISGMAAVSDSLVASNLYDGRLVILDPTNGQQSRGLEIGHNPVVVYSDGRRLWAAAALHTAAAARTLRVLVPAPLDSPDPGWPSGFDVSALTNDGLVGFRRASGSDGGQIVPDLATAIPIAGDGGKTWTFRLQEGVRYSTGGTVRPEDVRPSFERALAAGVPYFASIRGADHCGAGECDLSAGITADRAGRSVTFHLREPDPDFLAELAMPAASILPPDSPPVIGPESAGAADWGRFAATGPYRVRKVDGDTVVLVRNASFTAWAPEATPDGTVDRIELTYGVDPANAAREVAAGRADLALDPAAGQVGQLSVRFPTQLIRFDEPATVGLMLDTRRPPFDSLAARQAVASALDRTAVSAALADVLSRPSCQILPPVLVGYRPYCPYGTGPGSARHTVDLAAARELVRQSGTRGESVVLAAPDEQQPVAELLAATLRKLGYPTRVRIEADDSVYYELVSDPRRVPEAHLSRWGADLPVASSFAQLARCGNVGPGGLNTTGYCDQRSEQLIERALARQQVAPDEVAAAWQAVDRRLTDTVAWVPLVSTQGAVFASERVSTLVEVPLLGPAFERITLAPS